jgi:LysM repeat protein
VSEDQKNLRLPPQSLSKISAKKHTVKSRESLRSISDDYGVSIDAIVWANDISPDDELKIGQVLKIPPVS